MSFNNRNIELEEELKATSKDKAYIEVLKNSAVSFKHMWETECKEREKLQRKYDLLVQKIKDQGLERANANGFPLDREDELRNYAKDTDSFYEKLGEMAKDSNEPWDDDRMDIIGQNGNDGLHYDKEV